jgi:hypothetical protein
MPTERTRREMLTTLSLTAAAGLVLVENPATLYDFPKGT